MIRLSVVNEFKGSLWMVEIIMKKGNKQCLFDTPCTVMVNKVHDVRIQRPSTT